MAERSAAELHVLASAYDDHAHRFPVDHPARAANLAEASKYHHLAERSRLWPESKPSSSEGSDRG